MNITTLKPKVPIAPVGLSRTTRLALAAVAALGPACMAGWALTSSYAVADSIPTSAAKIMADPAGAQLSVLLLFLAGLLGAAGALVVGAAVRRGAPRFGGAAAAIAFVGFVVATYPGPVAAISVAPAAGLDDAQVLSLIAAYDAQPLAMLAGALFVCLPAGVLLLGIAAVLAARRGTCPVWVAVLLMASTPVIVIGGLISALAMGIGWLVASVAFGAAAWVYATAGDRTTM
ncbi:hypothetical protein [Occultella aeris]|nr:hypothetical protein [Occultella aeris]